jgi:hypothetical protein
MHCSLRNNSITGRLGLFASAYLVLSLAPVSMVYAQSTTASARVYDVTGAEYGALHNYNVDSKTGADDARAIGRAVSAINSSGGGELYLPAGKYYIGSNASAPGIIFNFLTSHVHVQCAPGAALYTNPSLTNGQYASNLFAFNSGHENSDDLRTIGGYAFKAPALVGAPSVTLTTASDARNFPAGSLVYLRGQDSGDSAPVGEFNWIVTADSGTGVLTLEHAVGVDLAKTTVAIPASRYVVYDVSVDGCEIHASNQQPFDLGQVIGAKFTNNTIFMSSATTGPFVVGSWQPTSDIEFASNKYFGSLESGSNSNFWQIGNGVSNVRFHDNVVYVDHNGALQASEGVSNLVISHNHFYASSSTSNLGIVGTCGNAWSVVISDNTITNASQANGIDVDCSNGSCHNCSVTGNTIYQTNTQGGAAIAVGYSNTPIAGNSIYAARYAIVACSSLGGTINGNVINLLGGSSGGIYICGNAPLAITGNEFSAAIPGKGQAIVVAGSAGSVPGVTVTGNAMNRLASFAGGGPITFSYTGNVCSGMTGCSGSPTLPVLGGTFSSASGTTASHTFARAFSATPQCAIAPTSDAGAWHVSAQSATAITVAYARSGPQKFTAVCFGSGGAW